MEMSSRAGRNPITFEVVDGYAHVGDLECLRLVGHPLTRRRWRYLQRAECIVVTESSRLLGVAAYQRVKSDIRVVHEFLVNSEVGERRVATVTDMLASAVEAMALSHSAASHLADTCRQRFWKPCFARSRPFTMVRRLSKAIRSPGSERCRLFPEVRSCRWGTRHRAGMGLAERSDAVIEVASEERGDVTVMHDGEFRRVDSAEEMLTGLRALFAPQTTVRSNKYFRRSEVLLQGMSIVLALVVVAATSLVAGTVVRVRTVPIEAMNLAPGLRIVDQSAVAAQVQLRWSSWALDSVGGAP